MSIQECALYGDLVRYVRDQCAARLAELDTETGEAAARAWLDQLICEWFFTPQEDLYGDAPRDVIWREHSGQPNIIPSEHSHDVFFDDCPVCQAMRELEGDGEWHWHYDDGGYPLIAEYDPEGWDAYWMREEESLARWRAEQEKGTDDFSVDDEGEMLYGFPDATAEEEAALREMWGLPPAAEEGPDSPEEVPQYDPPPVPSPEVSPVQLWLRLAEEPWLDPKLHAMARNLAGRLGIAVPEPPLSSESGNLGWHQLTFTEALPLITELHAQGVDVEQLLAQVRAFPYEHISMEWFIAPEKSIALMSALLDDNTIERDPASAARLRHCREFIDRVAHVIPLHARIWLRGWSDAITHAAFARAVGADDQSAF